MTPNRKGIAFLDWDGTTFLETTPLPHTASLLETLFQLDFDAVFVTNNSSRKTEYCRAILEANGLWCVRTSMVTSTLVTVDYLKNSLKCDRAFLLGNDALKEEFLEGGVRCDSDGPGVVVGFDTSLTYEKLQNAHRLLLHGAPFFVATHPDPVCPIAGSNMIDCGSLCAALRRSTGRAATVIGKPMRPMSIFLRKHFMQRGDSVIVIGDRADTDGLLARRLDAGFVQVMNNQDSDSLIESVRRAVS